MQYCQKSKTFLLTLTIIILHKGYKKSEGVGEEEAMVERRGMVKIGPYKTVWSSFPKA
jgi:hypothetical protein